MLKPLRDMVELIEGPDRHRQRVWFVTIGLAVLGDFGLIYAQIAALQKQRMGLAYGQEALMFVAAIALWTVATRRTWNRTGTGLANGIHALTDRIVDRLRRLPLHRFEALGRGDLMGRLTGDTQRIVNATPAVVNGPRALCRLTFGTVFALSVAPDVARFAILGMVIMGVVIAAQMRVMRASFGRIARSQARLYDLLRGHLGGAVPIKLHRPRSAAIGGVVDAVSAGLRDLRTGIFGAFFERQHGANAILYGVLGINVFLVPLIVQTDAEAIREINLVLVWVVFSVFGIVFTLPNLGQAADALGRLHALEARVGDAELEPLIDRAALGRERFGAFRSLAVRGLTFRYPEADGRAGFAVGPVDLTLTRGEIVFITGYNGSGKSTFLKMLTGLYPADGGDLVVDGALIGPGDLVDYRALFSTIFTDHHLFERAFGVTADAAGRASELLGAFDIAHKTGIADGRVTNRDLSTGQKKRLAMVLARLQDRPVLIFDEWAADQDPEYRALYYEEVLPALRDAGKLVIAVTHDDQYFACADRTFHVDDGRITEGAVGLGQRR